MSEDEDAAKRQLSNKLDGLSKENLVKFAKKQLQHLATLKATNASLRAKLDGEHECLQCAKHIEDLNAIKEKYAHAEVLNLELNDLELKVDLLNRALRDKTEALVKAHDVINDNDEKMSELRTIAKTAQTQNEEASKRAKDMASELERDQERNKKLLEKLQIAESNCDGWRDRSNVETMSLAKRMAASEHRARELEEVVEKLRDENLHMAELCDEQKIRMSAGSREFEAYKQRAKHILEQKKADSNADEKEENLRLREELLSASSALEQLRLNICEVSNSASSANSRADIFKNELDLARRAQRDSEERYLQSLDAMRSTNMNSQRELKEELRVAQMERDVAENKFAELEDAYQRLERTASNDRKQHFEQAARLQQQVDEALIKIGQRADAKPSEPCPPPPPRAVAAVVPHVSTPQTQSFPEFVRTPSVPPIHEPEISLEDVLYGGNDDGQASNDSFNPNNVSDDVERFRRTAEHVSQLLNEAETANSQLLEQNAVLKAEIRRLERSDSRQQELSNSTNHEYLKNILMRFLTPQCVEGEREQLRIVLERVLHLSQEESRVLLSTSEQLNLAQVKPVTNSWSMLLGGWG